MTEKYNSKRDRMENVVVPRSLRRLNDIIKENNIEYGEAAFIYSDTAIRVCKDVFVKLFKEKSKIKSYEDYKKTRTSKTESLITKKGQKGTIVDVAVEIWENEYDSEELINARDNLFREIIKERNKERNKEERNINENKNPFAKYETD